MVGDLSLPVANVQGGYMLRKPYARLVGTTQGRHGSLCRHRGVHIHAQWGQDRGRPFKNEFEREANRELLKAERQIEGQLQAVRSKLAKQQTEWQRDVKQGSWGNLLVPGALALTAAATLSLVGGSLLLGLLTLPLTLALGVFGGALSLVFLPVVLFSGVAMATVMATGALLSLLPLLLLGGAAFYVLRAIYFPAGRGERPEGKERARRRRDGVYEVEVEDTSEEDDLRRDAYNELNDFDQELRRREARCRDTL